MNAKDRDFMSGMWEKAKAREENERLAEKLICAGAAEKSGRMGMALFFRDMLRGIGIRQVCAGMADVLCSAFAVTFCLLYLLAKGMWKQGLSMDMAVFGGSPLLYGCIFLLFWIKESQSGLYGLQMSCKYTFFHVLAARMLAASLMGMCFNGLYVLVLILRYEADGLRLLAISFSSLTCFSVLLTAGLEKGRRFLWAAVVCGGWAAGNLTAFFCFARWYGDLLGRIPVYLFLGTGAVGLLFYFRQLLFMTTLDFRKEYTDAAN